MKQNPNQQFMKQMQQQQQQRQRRMQGYAWQQQQKQRQQQQQQQQFQQQQQQMQGYAWQQEQMPAGMPHYELQRKGGCALFFQRTMAFVFTLIFAGAILGAIGYGVGALLLGSGAVATLGAAVGVLFGLILAIRAAAGIDPYKS